MGLERSCDVLLLRLYCQLLGRDIQQEAGSIQLCFGQTSGIEAAVHDTNEAYHDNIVQAVFILLLDAGGG